MFFEIKIYKKQKNFIFFTYFLKLINHFNIYDIKINKFVSIVGKKNFGFFILSLNKIFLFISEIFSFIFLNN